LGRRVGVSGSFREISRLISIEAKIDSPLGLVRDESDALWWALGHHT
jgi:hypothetical protein